VSGAVLGLEVKSGLELKEMLEEAMELAANKVVGEIFDPEEEEEEEEETEEDEEEETGWGANGSDGALTDLEEGFVADKCVVGVV
jgi:hypothetical protein